MHAGKKKAVRLFVSSTFTGKNAVQKNYEKSVLGANKILSYYAEKISKKKIKFLLHPSPTKPILDFYYRPLKNLLEQICF